jgi:type IV pilus assembly protein PilB
LPTFFGEKTVIRILKESAHGFSLETLGFHGEGLERIHEALKQKTGIVLATGPTGSGKTSTLYAVLTQLNTTDVNIITVEDPVEYQLVGVNQVQVKADIGLTFAGGLRSILRQDPDIVMVGEIRDSETADIAVKAALTGHLVLSTLHTNDAPGAVARMIDMGIEPFLVSSSVLMVCAQRLIRKICPHCKEELPIPPEVIQRLGCAKDALSGTVFYHGRGCGRCKETGFLGRTAIHEVMAGTDAIREQILRDAGIKAIRDIALKEGMKTLRQAGLDKAKAGITSLDEILRVTGSEY